MPSLIQAEPRPTIRLQQKAMAAIRLHAWGGTLFQGLACALPWEFRMLFIPKTTSAMIGVGCVAAGARTADQSVPLSSAAWASICARCARLLVA